MEPPHRHLSPAAERRQGETHKARLGFILIALLVLVVGVLLYYRLSPRETVPAAGSAGSVR